MTAAYRIGPRPVGDDGIFIAPPGVDALTAAPLDLLLSVEFNIGQYIMRNTASNGSVIQLGLPYVPVFMLTSIRSWSELNGTYLGRPDIMSGDGSSAEVQVQFSLSGGLYQGTVTSAVIPQIGYFALRQELAG